MIDTQFLYRRFDIKCPSVELIRSFISTATWDCRPSDYMTIAKNLDVIAIRRIDRFINCICDEFSTTLRVYQFPRNSWYEWHRDAYNACSLNMVIDEYDAKTLFKLGPMSDGSGQLHEIVELKYAVGKWYAFNSQIPHCITNGDNVRYLVTLGILPPFSYDELLDFCVKYESGANIYED
jgi:hypothetical protein